MYIKKCPECDSTHLQTDRERGEMTCRDCGLIIEENMIDFNKEWKDFDDKEGKNARAGAPLTYTKPELMTQIGNRNDFNKIKQKDKFIRMAKWQYRSTTMEKNLKLALAHLKQTSSFLKLPAFVEEETARIYNQVVKKGLTKGRSIEPLIAGALYIACKKYDIPRTFKEIKEASGCNKRDVMKSYKLISRSLSLKFTPTDPTSFVSKFANKLNISPEIESNALKILEEAEKKGVINGKIPIGIAAASLYIATMLNCEKKTQEEIAEVAGVTAVTIRKRCQDLVKGLAEELKVINLERNER